MKEEKDKKPLTMKDVVLKQFVNSTLTLDHTKKALTDLEEQLDLSKKQFELAKKQSLESGKQFKLSLFLTLTALALTLISIFPIFTKSSELNKLEHIIELQLKESETIREMSNDLDSLRNQVKSLEKQNELLLSKKTLKK